MRAVDEADPSGKEAAERAQAAIAKYGAHTTPEVRPMSRGRGGVQRAPVA